MNRIVTVFFVFSLLFYVNSFLQAQVFLQDERTDGIVSMEAEHYSLHVPAGDDSPWNEIDDEQASGGKAMQTPNNDISNARAGEGARLDYYIYFSQTGDHYLWIRGYAETWNEDSFYAGLDGETPKLFAPEMPWGWSIYRKFKINVATTGVHTLNIYRREDGYVLDKILLTTNSEFTPTDMGPPESSQIDINLKPTIDDVPWAYSYIIGSGNQTITFTGITDGDQEDEQLLTATAFHEPTSVIDNLTVGEIDANGALDLTFDVSGIGSVAVELVIKDDGGTEYQAVDSLVVNFDIVVYDTFEVSYTDEFDGELNASASTDFQLNLENEMLHIQMHTQAKWQGVSYEIGRPVNMAFHPFMNLKIKTDVPFVLSAYIVDANDANIIRTAKVYATEHFVNYVFDFSDYADKGVDASQITNLIFTPNGASRGLDADNIYFDDLKLGIAAEKLASIGGISGVRVYQNSQKIDFLVTDLKNTSLLEITGADQLITAVNVSPIENGLATVQFDCQPDSTGSDSLVLTAKGAPGYVDNSVYMPLEVEGNYQPVIQAVENQSAAVGQWHDIHLAGIGDGNKSVEQPLTITANSDNQNALPDSNITIQHPAGQTTALLSYLPLNPQNDIQLSVTVNDGEPVNNETTISFSIDAFADFNNPPTINTVPNQDVLVGAGKQSVLLTGISDGGAAEQILTFRLLSSEDLVVPNADLSVEYSQGDSTAVLNFSPGQPGKSKITVTVIDDGGMEGNNGDQQAVIEFFINVRVKPSAGYEIPFTNYEADKWRVWSVETDGRTMFTSYTDTDSGKALTFDCRDKWIWNGVWFGFDPVDVREHPYFSMEVKVECPMYFWMWFYDPDTAYTGSTVGKRNTNYNIPDMAKRVSSGQWTLISFDFSNLGLKDGTGTPLWADQIVAVLLNFHHVFYSNEGTPNYNGTVMIRNLKIGDRAKGIAEKQPVATIDPIADQVNFENQGVQHLELSGISDGDKGEVIPTVTAVSNNPDFISDPAVSPVNPDGAAQLTYQQGEGTGSAQITITVSARGSQDKVITFYIQVISGETEYVVQINRDSTFQTIRGFGTFSNSEEYIDLYARDLGASAMRLGLIGNQIEPVNDNNDPNVLDLNAFNYSAFDFNYYRKLKQAGVETFILTSWSPPAWMKRNLTLDYFTAQAVRWEDTDNVLEPYYYDEFAESMVAAVKMFKDQAGIDLYAIGPQNEPAFNEPYPSAILSPKRFAELIAIIGARFEREGINTKIYMPEQVFSQGHYPMQHYIDLMQANPNAYKYTDIIATHGYDTDGIGEQQPDYSDWQIMWKNAHEGDYPKEVWMTETFPEYQNWNSALSLAGAIHGALWAGNVSLWTLWNIDGTLIESGEPTASYYTSKNYYKYIRPGANRIKADVNHQDLLVTAFDHKDHKRVTVVIIHKGSAAKSIVLEGSSLPPSFEIYNTAKNRNFEFVGTTNGAKPVALPAKSVTTLFGIYESDIAVADDTDSEIPVTYRLFQNYPNPFNPATTIEFQIPEAAQVHIRIYDILGREVRNFVHEHFPAGIHRIHWDGKNSAGMTVASGVYLYRFRANNFVSVKKSVLIR